MKKKKRIELCWGSAEENEKIIREDRNAGKCIRYLDSRGKVINIYIVVVFGGGTRHTQEKGDSDI